MSKKKFILTDDLIRVEKEPLPYSKKEKKNILRNETRRISLNIDGELKTKLHTHCVNSKKTMTELIEELFLDYINRENL